MRRKSDDRFTDVAYCEQPNFAKRKGKQTSATTKGLAFERRVLELLSSGFGQKELRRLPWIRYREVRSKRVKYCQPDAFVPSAEFGIAYIFEIKLSYRSAAKTKLRSLYLPLLKKLHPEIKVWHTIQICKNLTPHAKKEKRIIKKFEDIQKPHETLWLPLT